MVSDCLGYVSQIALGAFRVPRSENGSAFGFQVMRLIFLRLLPDIIQTPKSIFRFRPLASKLCCFLRDPQGALRAPRSVDLKQLSQIWRYSDLRVRGLTLTNIL